jgi:outer membrane protein
MKLIFRFIIALLFVQSAFTSLAQQTFEFSLQEAIDYAMQNNYEVIYSEKNIEAAKQQMKEATAFGLPQIDGALDYADNIERPTSLIPGEFFGEPGQDIEIQFGTKYSMNAGLYASQLLYSGKYIVGLKTAKIFMEQASIDFFKDKVAVKQQVADSYYNVLATEEQLRVVDTTLKVTQKIANETRLTYEVGFAEDVDVDQLDLLVSDLEASRVYLDNQLSIAHAYLKFFLGLENEDTVVLKDEMFDLIEKRKNSEIASQIFNVNENIDYVSLAKTKEIRFMQIKLEQTAYQPTLAATINLQTNAQRNSWDFFNPDGTWYPSSVFGVNLIVPIWSSGERRAKVKQAQIAYDQINVQQDQLKVSLRLQYQTALNEYFNAYSVYQNRDKSRKVAAKIFKTTSIKFTEGMASSIDILNTQNQFLESERAFIESGRILLQSGQELDKLLTKAINP